jgi:hypothetical protein
MVDVQGYQNGDHVKDRNYKGAIVPFGLRSLVRDDGTCPRRRRILVGSLHVTTPYRLRIVITAAQPETVVAKRGDRATQDYGQD